MEDDLQSVIIMNGRVGEPVLQPLVGDHHKTADRSVCSTLWILRSSEHPERGALHRLL